MTGRSVSEAEGYLIHVWIRQITPIIWRRLLVRSDNTLADLHYTLQIAFAWTDYHLHRFRIHGKEFGILRMGGPWYSEDARNVRLTDFQFRVNERFLYEYDLGDLLGQIAECVRERNRTALRDRIEEIPELEEWLLSHKV